MNLWRKENQMDMKLYFKQLFRSTRSLPVQDAEMVCWKWSSAVQCWKSSSPCCSPQNNPHQELYTGIFGERVWIGKRQRHKPHHNGCILFCILSLWSHRRDWKTVDKKCPLLGNGIWEIAATGMMLSCEHWDNELRRLREKTMVGQSVWNDTKNEGRKKVNQELTLGSSKFLQWAHSSSEQQQRRERHWDGIRYTA